MSLVKGDSLSYHNGQQFSTTDRDHDVDNNNCASISGGGGWWFKSCKSSNLNGKYFSTPTVNCDGIGWYLVQGHDDRYSFKKTEMRIARGKYC